MLPDLLGHKELPGRLDLRVKLGLPDLLGQQVEIIIALLWYMMIITFHYALRFKIKVNRFRNENRKNRKEAEFIEKMERRKRRKEYILNEQNKENKAEKPHIYQNNGSDDWSDLFSD